MKKPVWWNLPTIMPDHIALFKPLGGEATNRDSSQFSHICPSILDVHGLSGSLAQRRIYSDLLLLFVSSVNWFVQVTSPRSLYVLRVARPSGCFGSSELR
jgi:hypothetical protein|uniref:Uncharacterized protein n=1 Tax=Bionectria ochroleuca TaxID=29856 RepID=A0A8H7TUX1_BIOOC